MAENRKAANFNFGFKGWRVIILTFGVCMFVVINGTMYMNMFTPAIAEARGWSYPLLLSFSTYAGYAGLVLFPFVCQLTIKKGPKFVMTAALFVAAAGMALLGNAVEIWQYILAVVLLRFGLMSFLNGSMGALANNWWPFRKGFALGIITIGMHAADSTMPTAIGNMQGMWGLGVPSLVLAGFEVVLAVLFIFFIKSTPEEHGVFPDNNPVSVEESRKVRELLESHKSEWTFRKLVTTPFIWHMALPTGIMWLATVGIMSQIVPRFLDLGFGIEYALLGISLAGICGLFGSYFWGWLDQKFGTKRAVTIFLIYYSVVYLLFAVSSSLPLMILCVIMGGFGTGGNANLCPSLTGTIFGRLDFPAVQKFSGLVQDFFFVTAPGIVAFSLAFLGGFRGAYLILLVVCIVGTILIATLNDRFRGTPG